MIDFDWYRSFIAVYRQGTVSRAAAERFLTQPAISQHIAALEKVMGTALFQRTPRRMVPTEYGKAFYAQIAPSLDALEQITGRIGQDDQAPLPLRLGAPAEYFGEVALAQLIQAHVPFWVRFDVTPRLIEAVERDELDLVIATQRIPVQGIDYVRLLEETFWLVGSPSGALPGDDLFGDDECTLMEQWLTTQRWISYGPDLPIIRRFWQQTFAHRPTVQPLAIIPDLHTIREAVIAGLGISLLPDYLCRKACTSGQIQVLWEPPEPITNTIWLATRRERRQEPALRRLREVLMQECNDL